MMVETMRDAPGDGLAIEVATWRDLNGVRELEKACFPVDAWPLWDIIGILTVPNVVRLKAVNSGPGNTGQVRTGHLVGFVAGDIRAHENTAWIATIGVLPSYRGRGIGAALLRA